MKIELKKGSLSEDFDSMSIPKNISLSMAHWFRQQPYVSRVRLFCERKCQIHGDTPPSPRNRQVGHPAKLQRLGFQISLSTPWRWRLYRTEKEKSEIQTGLSNQRIQLLDVLPKYVQSASDRKSILKRA